MKEEEIDKVIELLETEILVIEPHSQEMAEEFRRLLKAHQWE